MHITHGAVVATPNPIECMLDYTVLWLLVLDPPKYWLLSLDGALIQLHCSLRLPLVISARVLQVSYASSAEHSILVLYV